ncbi:ubiquitin carboxyl-terminal hydrolase isozyme L3, partial [Pseudophryne corroboree]|uniref:ubiquitin carboxyl-terminal hydrolase isozyme L3 n=1 Tax=Pseudophryne corroboree TaxID=495146 RepID=UPI0030820B69
FQFLKQLGVGASWQFVDVYGLDADLLSLVPRPVCAVLLLFPVTGKYELSRADQEEKIKSHGQDVDSSVYFMKQTIRNACGTMGLIHAVANNREKLSFESDSPLKKFIDESISMSPEDRAKFLERDESIRVTHESSAQEGQSELQACSVLLSPRKHVREAFPRPSTLSIKCLHSAAKIFRFLYGEFLSLLYDFHYFTRWQKQSNQSDAPNIDDKVDLHFIAFVHQQGHLYELDGSKPFPVNHGRTSEDTLLEDAIEVCRKFMQRDPDELRFTVVAFSKV